MKLASVALWLNTLISIAIGCRKYLRRFLSLVLLLTMWVLVLVLLLVDPVVVVVVVVVMVVVAMAVVVVIVVLVVGGSPVIELSFEFVALDFAV